MLEHLLSLANNQTNSINNFLQVDCHVMSGFRCRNVIEDDEHDLINTNLACSNQYPCYLKFHKNELIYLINEYLISLDHY